MRSKKELAARLRRWCWIVLLPVLLGLRGTAFAAVDQTIYDEVLAPGWQNWSWASVDLASTAQANTGTVSAAVTSTPYAAFYLRYWTPDPQVALDTNGYLNISFYIHGGATGGQTLQIQAIVGDTAQAAVRVTTPTAGSWQKVTVPLSALGADNHTNVNGFWIQEVGGVDAPTYYVDTIVLESGVPPEPPPPVNGMAIYQEGLANGWNNW